MIESSALYPKISVIVPNYNYEKYLHQRLDCILHQTFQPFEVILMDDCSTDGSVNILNEYSHNPLVTQLILNEQNSGSTFKQWAKGIQAAKGDWIWIAESDDYCELTLLQQLAEMIVQYPDSVIAYSDVKIVNQDGESRDSIRSFKNQYFTGDEFLKRYLSMSCMIRNASSVLFKREAALAISDKYLCSICSGDYWFWTEMATKGAVIKINKQLSYFRRHDSTVSSKKDRNGTNFTGDHEVFEFISSKVKINRWRKKLIKAYYTQRIAAMNFDSEEIRKKVQDVWKVNSRLNLPEKIMLKIYYKLINKFNYYL